MPFTGTHDDRWYFNSIVERLAQDPGMGEVRTNYLANVPLQRRFVPDLIVDIKPTVTYRSSGWNFLINWPGFLIFTPAWHGYVYRADVMTRFVLYTPDGELIDQFDVPMSYNLRHADGDRTIWTGLTWLEVSLLAFGGGIYNANNFDRDAIAPLYPVIHDSYATYVLADAQTRIRTVAIAVTTPPQDSSIVEPQGPTEDAEGPDDVGAPGPKVQTPTEEDAQPR